MRDSLDRLRELWQNTSRVNQILTIAVIGAAVLAGIIFMYVAGTPDFQPLVTPAPEEYDKIVGILDQKKINWRVRNNTLEVPAERVPELRMALAGQGLLNSGSMGYSLLDRVPLGQTQAMEQETIRRAREGEMEKAIQSLEQVAAASVRFTEGDSSPFVTPERKDPTAAIVIHLKPGQELNKANIRAIVSLVRCAWSGLSEKNITIVDGQLDPIWDGSHAEGALDSDDRFALEHAFNEAKSREIQGLISPALPPNSFAVFVHSELNLDRETQTTHEATTGPKSERFIEEEGLTGGGSIKGNGVPAGLASNAGGAANPTTYAANVTADSGKYTHTTTREKTATGFTETQTIKTPGEVKSWSVGVLLDKSVVDAQTADKVRSLIATSIGANPSDPNNARRVVVQTIPFDKKRQEADMKASQSAVLSEQIGRWVGYSVPFLLMLVMLFVLSRSLRRTPTGELAALMGGARPALAGAGAKGQGLNLIVGDSPIAGLSVGEVMDGEKKVIAVDREGEKIRTFEVISEAFDANLESIQHLTRSKPETVAQLIRSWMREDER
jgi:flagellar M-ring protein FliF